MADKYRNAYTRCRYFDFWIDNFFGFCNHLPLFSGCTIFHEAIYVWNYIKSDLFCERFWGNIFYRIIYGLCLLPKFIHSTFPSPRNRLICTNDNSFNTSSIMQRFQSHDHLSSRTVRVSYYISLGILMNSITIHLWNN